MAQRQYMRKIRTGGARFEDVYRAVSEYRRQYPDKAVIYSAQKAPELCWASLMAGGSCAAIPVSDESFLKALAAMQPDGSLADKGVYRLNSPQGSLIYNDTDADVTVDKKMVIVRIDMKNGEQSRQKQRGTIGKGLYWLKQK